MKIIVEGKEVYDSELNKSIAYEFQNREEALHRVIDLVMGFEITEEELENFVSWSG